MTRSRLGRVTERGFGAADPKRQPFFFNSPPPLQPKQQKYSNSPLIRFHSPDNWNARHPQHMFDFRFFQSRSIVLELQPVLLFIKPEFLQAIRIRKKSQLP